VLVVGGGLAGLSSAVALAEAGFAVRLLEKRPHLGGRATSYTLPDGNEVDNCQHVTLGCCTNLADFYRRAGAEDKIKFYDTLYFADAQGRRSTIKGVALPAPLHLAPSFAFFGGLGLADKVSIARALLAIGRSGGKPPEVDISMLDWLHQMKQTPGAIERFWRVVLVSALDEDLAKTDARYGIQVFWQAFLSSRSGYKVGIPLAPLGELYEGCREAVIGCGGEVRLRCGVREIRIQNDSFAGVILEDGSELSADACIVAVPQDTLPDLLSAELKQKNPAFEGLHNIRTSPITGVHLWFDRQVMQEPFLALLEHTTQWVFNKTALYGKNETNGGGARHRDTATKDKTESSSGLDGQYLQLVISASYDLVTRSRQDIIELCMRELAGVLPATREATLQKATVIKEIHATFSPEPGVEAWRLGQDSGVKGLFLAGDWTRTGWPSTMEGAVRSGYLASEMLLKSFGQSQRLLQPDIAPEGFSKLWAR
jgi:squalene-associated FAD-dependent desaturase